MPSEVVLIVEDDDPVRQMMERALEDLLHVDTVLAANGLEALEVVWSIKPMLIILDLRMPELDGFQMLAALKSRADTRGIPVVVVTGLPNACQQMLAAGADGCIAKPFDMTRFAEVVREYLPRTKAAGGRDC